MIRKHIVLIAALLLAFISTTAFAAYQRTADNTVPAYRNEALTQRTGNERVDKGDLVTVFQETDKAYYVRYPVRNGTKDRWVPKNIFNAQTRSVPAQTSNTATIADGWYRIQPMHDMNRSLDALGPQIGNGNNVHMWTNADIDQQKFYVQNRGGGFFSLQSAYGSRLFVTADGRNPGANLYTSSWNGSDTQLFRLVNAGNGYYYVMAKAGVNLIFDCAGGGQRDGNNVGLWSKDHDNVGWYKWKFSSVSVSGSSGSSANSSSNVRDRLVYAVFHNQNARISCDFDGYKNTSGRHEGIDIVLTHKAPVYAAISGTVTKAGGGSYNTFAIYDASNDKTVVYLHFSSIANGMYTGRHVEKGELIGYQGNTGAPQGSHVHIEVRNGQRTAAAKSVNDPKLDNPNPYEYWNRVL